VPGLGPARSATPRGPAGGRRRGRGVTPRIARRPRSRRRMRRRSRRRRRYPSIASEPLRPPV
jgi:hypothetical protein